MADERPWMSMDVPDFVREAEEAMARGETLGDSYAEVTIPGFSGKRRYSEAEKNRILHNPKKSMQISKSCGL